MSVWLCIPSKRPLEEAEKCLKLWRERGYKIALWRDEPIEWNALCDEVLTGTYPGYSVAVNSLVDTVLRWDKYCDWVVLGGDDIEPDMNHSAEEIARECSLHFGSEQSALDPKKPGIGMGPWHSARGWESTWGVMQPTGDRYGEDARSIERYGKDRAAYADRVCGSPWVGREFALRINQGKGPLWPEYTHMYEDEELFEVASKYGVLWQRRDLVHLHNHWARPRGRAEDMPEFLREVNSPEHWNKYKALFEQRKAAGFPGSEPL